MKRNSSTVTQSESPKKNKQKAKKRIFSTLLENDQRVSVAPRYSGVLHQGVFNGRELVVMVKVYAGVAQASGSELLTMSCIDAAATSEFEMRLDESFPTSIRFRAQSDEERVAYAREQIERSGGFDKFFEIMRLKFAKFASL